MIADHVRTDAEAVALALAVPVLEERRHLGREGDVVGDRLDGDSSVRCLPDALPFAGKRSKVSQPIFNEAHQLTNGNL